MKTLEQLKNEISIENGYSNWEQMYNCDTDLSIDSIDKLIKVYKNEFIKDLSSKIISTTKNIIEAQKMVETIESHLYFDGQKDAYSQSLAFITELSI